MIRIAVVLGALLAVAGCKKEEAPAPGAAPAAAASAKSGKVNCERLVPEAIRSKYFKGVAMTQKPMCPGCPEECSFASGQTVMADCRMGAMPNFLNAISSQWEQAGFKKESGIGRATFSNLEGEQVLFVPAKHNCYVTVTWLGGKSDVKELAREIDDALTADALGL